MLWRGYCLRLGNNNVLLPRAGVGQLRRANDRPGLVGVVGPVGGGNPSAAWGDEDGFADELGSGRGDGRTSRLDDAVAVGEKRLLEGDAGVEVLADEEVAVVEGAGPEADEKLAGAGGRFGDGV